LIITNKINQSNSVAFLLHIAYKSIALGRSLSLVIAKLLKHY